MLGVTTGEGKKNVPSSLLISILQALELAYACHHQWSQATMPSGSLALFREPNKRSGAAVIYLNQSTGMSLWRRALAFPLAPFIRDREGYWTVVRNWSVWRREWGKTCRWERWGSGHGEYRKAEGVRQMWGTKNGRERLGYGCGVRNDGGRYEEGIREIGRGWDGGGVDGEELMNGARKERGRMKCSTLEDGRQKGSQRRVRGDEIKGGMSNRGIRF